MPCALFCVADPLCQRRQIRMGAPPPPLSLAGGGALLGSEASTPIASCNRPSAAWIWLAPSSSSALALSEAARSRRLTNTAQVSRGTGRTRQELDIEVADAQPIDHEQFERRFQEGHAFHRQVGLPVASVGGDVGLGAALEARFPGSFQCIGDLVVVAAGRLPDQA
ncbi:hypothetical protein ACFQGW_12870 [Xanthomonas theicola]|uniref:hypothetical protein n=1 Tax=Xanthomonas theicola TaxID=56464 RepID=UPI00360634D2